ncbi:MAG: substrate-binding domain-containing protein [Oscillospiraceae bacterium]|nr:substrate-binding domain-containing protein [Oscillospiraceae bacterium]
MLKKIGCLLFAVALILSLASCAGKEESITVLTREDGSGTRGAFVELFELKSEDGGDAIKADAEVKNATSVILTSVAGNKNSIGYISLGSLNDTVKALKIDGVTPSAENVANGSYKVSRPFIIAHMDTLSDAAQDFINYILSNQGQDIIDKNGYVKMTATGDYTPGTASGKVVIGGSSSVSPVMEKLKEAYESVNPDISVEIQTSDSSTGLLSAISGVYEIAMSSRELKESETSAGLLPTVIAIDGIAVIVNKENSLSNIKKEQVSEIYKGEITVWSNVG